MPRLPTTTLSRFAKRPILQQTAIAQRHLATEQKPGDETVGGESDKSKQKAQPKILNQSPPNEADASEEVKQHNREMDQRADKPATKVKDEDVEKDKVSKGFWGGGDKVGATKDGG